MLLATKQIPRQVGRRQTRPKPPGRDEIFLPKTLDREPQPLSKKSEFKRGMIMRKLMMTALFALPLFGATAVAQDTLKIAWIDPLSGGAASAGERALKTFRFLANELNAKDGVLGKQVEIVP